jgi:hypothetical protein
MVATEPGVAASSNQISFPCTNRFAARLLHGGLPRDQICIHIVYTDIYDERKINSSKS